MSIGFRLRIALVGHPVDPDVRWDDAQLGALRALGFNMVQLNIAWGSRPGDEPLNLEDVLPVDGAERAGAAARRAELNRRAAMARRYGLRTLFHFGAPYVGKLYQLFKGDLEKKHAVEACILRPEIHARCARLVEELGRHCPDLDDLLVYTYDQDAYLCGEFGECPRCAGVPLHERLPAFLRTLCDAWRAVRPTGRLWWEPWELSAGQTYKIVDLAPVDNFGLMLHANVAEVQMGFAADRWFRALARQAAQRGIPVVGETYLSMTNEEVQPLQSVPEPAALYARLAALRSVEGLVGVKEYYGMRPDAADPNLALAAAVFAQPDIARGDALAQVATPYGAAAPALVRGWCSVSDALTVFPYDVVWRMRQQMGLSAYHPWDAFYFEGHLVDTPSWCSTRRTVFMTTEHEPDHHPWFIEDLALRWEMSIAHADEALRAYAEAAALAPAERREEIERWIADLRALRRVAKRLELHAKETLVALHLRKGATPERVARMRALLEADAENQAGAPRPGRAVASAGEMLERFTADPAAWAAGNLLPREAMCLW